MITVIIMIILYIKAQWFFFFFFFFDCPESISELVRATSLKFGRRV